MISGWSLANVWSHQRAACYLVLACISAWRPERFPVRKALGVWYRADLTNTSLLPSCQISTSRSARGLGKVAPSRGSTTSPRVARTTVTVRKPWRVGEGGAWSRILVACDSSQDWGLEKENFLTKGEEPSNLGFTCVLWGASSMRPCRSALGKCWASTARMKVSAQLLFCLYLVF